MAALTEVKISPLPLERYAPIVGEAEVQAAIAAANAMRERAAGRSIWNVNSTEVGGGVAEMLRPLLSHARGAGVDARWAVISGSPEFFRVTKRIHNALHGEVGDGSPLGHAEHRIYDATLCHDAQELLAVVRENDVVLLHDPQTLGLAAPLARAGAKVIWRCHIGADTPNEETARGWSFLEPYLRDVHMLVFSREEYVPPFIERGRITIIQPSLDPFSPKNAPMEEDAVQAILGHVGLVAPTSGAGAPVFVRADGSPGRVDHLADVVRLGPPPSWATPLVTQVSRWDRLKDPLGVLDGFARLSLASATHGANLVLVGPNVKAVADDPDGAAVFDEVVKAYRELPHSVRGCVHLANLPTVDVEENAAIVNALQRHSTIVVQKSIKEGFGLTVTEAMWKARPVIGSAVGGIQDQIVDGESGLLLRNPRDLDAFAGLLKRLLEDPEGARKMGERAQERARERFLGVRHLLQYARLIEQLDR